MLSFRFFYVKCCYDKLFSCIFENYLGVFFVHHVLYIEHDEQKKTPKTPKRMNVKNVSLNAVRKVNGIDI